MSGVNGKTRNIIPVILAGGSGDRLWPISRPDLPKQFHPIMDQGSLFTQTLSRLSDFNFDQKPIIMTNEKHVPLVTAQLSPLKLSDVEIISEPSSQDTAPAILIAALIAFKRNSNSQILILPSDHRINNIEVVKEALENNQLKNSPFVAFGIKAEESTTGYGYIKLGQESPDVLQNITAFVEEPGREAAEAFCEQTTYLWNSGMYLFSTSRLIDKLQELEPEMVHDGMAAIFRGEQQENCFELEREAYLKTPKISIDHALMEKIEDAKVLRVSPKWNDFGSWASVWKNSGQDGNGNVMLGNVVCRNTHGSYIRSEGQLTAVFGLDDIVVVTTDDAVLVAKKSEVHNLKQLVRKLKKQNRKANAVPPSIERP
ncbi:MAG: NTP transferase domain-containing protein [Emcibacter sp.]|nr:NTP transferase domain-containing protein [Emcibacter sp.]